MLMDDEKAQLRRFAAPLAYQAAQWAAAAAEAVAAAAVSLSFKVICAALQ